MLRGAIDCNMCRGQGADRVNLNGHQSSEAVREWFKSHYKHLFLTEFLWTVELNTPNTSDMAAAAIGLQLQQLITVELAIKSSYRFLACFR